MSMGIWERCKWYFRNSKQIDRLQRQAADNKSHLHGHYYCELHGSMDCDHSTWTSKTYRDECAKIDQWLKAELAKLP